MKALRFSDARGACVMAIGGFMFYFAAKVAAMGRTRRGASIAS